MEAPVNLVHLTLQVLQELPWMPLELTLQQQMPLSMVLQPLLMLLDRSPILPLVTPILRPLRQPQLNLPQLSLPQLNLPQLSLPHELWNKDEKAFNEEKQFEFLLGYIYYKLLGIKFCCFKY
jgi:hypothetical protein